MISYTAPLKDVSFVLSDLPEMLRLIVHCALAWFCLNAARVAQRKRAQDSACHDRKRDTACYYFSYVLPELQQLCSVIDACLRNHDDAGGNTFRSDS